MDQMRTEADGSDGSTVKMSGYSQDIAQPVNINEELLTSQHIDFIKKYGDEHSKYEYGMTDYLRLSGMYWGLTALELMNAGVKDTQDDVVKYIVKCQDPSNGGISACIDHDAHILHTLSGIQILAMFDKLDAIDIDGVVRFVQSLQQEDGSFSGDRWGETDTRFSFCAVMILSILKRMHVINIDRAIRFVESCKNFDGGFGSKPLSETHAGLTYCCVGFLSITRRLDLLEIDNLAWWLCERQSKSGGFNGRPEKLSDVCYSWWVLATLKILGKLTWIDGTKLKSFILACQDKETGGFSDRPKDLPDPFHTLFAVAALSLLGYENLQEVNPTYCMPQHVIDRLQLKPAIMRG